MDITVGFGDIIVAVNISEFAIAMMALAIISWIRR
jgi:hypothetical protein